MSTPGSGPAPAFEDQVKAWVALDTQLKTLNERVKQLRDEKNARETAIMQFVETNNLSNATVNISDGRLRFVHVKQTAPLTLKYVEECLKRCIPNATHVDTIMQVIKNNRETKEVPDIKRYYNKT
jgi:hypothetical protein